jgi:hypothetical protein
MKTNQFKYIFQSGLYVGLALILSFFLTNSTFSLLLLLGKVLFIITPVVIYFFVRDYRDKHCEGTFSYSQAFLFSWGIFLVSGFAYEIVQFIYMQFINPNILQEVIESGHRMLENQQAPAESVKLFDAIIRPGFLVAFGYIVLFIIGGGIASLVIGTGAQKKQNPFQ